MFLSIFFFIIFKGKDALWGKLDQENRVQAIIPELGNSICKPNDKSAVEIKLVSPRLTLEVDSPAKHIWEELV